jgi:hypothetical protein
MAGSHKQSNSPDVPGLFLAAGRYVQNFGLTTITAKADRALRERIVHRSRSRERLATKRTSNGSQGSPGSILTSSFRPNRS